MDKRNVAVVLLTCALLAKAHAEVLASKRANTDTLRFVHAVRSDEAIIAGFSSCYLTIIVQVWRHGDRTPSILIPSDTGNNASSWELGLGELTKEGLAQEYRLGRFLRERYDGFLAKQYSPFEIYIRSSVCDPPCLSCAVVSSRTTTAH